MISDWFPMVLTDILSFLFSVLLLLVYHAYLRSKVRKDPSYTIQALNRTARTKWVENFMRSGTPDVIPIQTLRNSTMAATFLASTAVLLIMGVLTLSAQTQGDTWHILNAYGTSHNELWVIKLMLLLINLFVAFFSFSMAIRIFNHVGFLINLPMDAKHHSMTPQHVASYLNSAGWYYSVGMRTYYYCVPLVFWLFGPLFMILATAILIPLLYKHDRAPKVLAEDFN